MKLCLQLCPELGFEVQTSDLTIMLLRSLTHDVRSYATLHASSSVGDAALLRCFLRRSNAMFAKLSGPSSSGARGVHALEGAGTTEEWWGYDQEGYDNSEYAQEEDPDDQWEWDEDAQVWNSATTRCKRKGKSQEQCEVSLVRTSRAHGQAVQGRYEQGESVFIAPSLVTLVRNAPTSPKVQQGNSKRSPSRKLERAKVKERCMSWQRRMIMSLPQYKVR